MRGREIEAAVLFADITAFSARTVDLDPTETLAFVNHFFAWISAEALNGRPGIVDKYIGDEVMVVFSKEFGSEDPFLDAVQAARWMGQDDVYAFGPHVGIACGQVIVGYVGTPLRYNCSVFGAPVAMAARCAGLAPPEGTRSSCTITFPANDWGERNLDAVFPPQKVRNPNGTIEEQPQSWRLLDPHPVGLKNLGRSRSSTRSGPRSGFPPSPRLNGPGTPLPTSPARAVDGAGAARRSWWPRVREQMRERAWGA